MDKKFIIGAVGAVLLILLIVAVLSLSKGKPGCGDGTCQKGESCCKDCGCQLDSVCNTKTDLCEKADFAQCGDGVCDKDEVCCTDCKCRIGETCNQATQKCNAAQKTTPPQNKTSAQSIVCGNNKCEIGENQWNCCSDCVCKLNNMICNAETNACETDKKIDMPDQDAINYMINDLIAREISTDNLNFSVSDDSGSLGACKRVCYTRTDIEVMVGGCACVYRTGEVLDYVEFI
jgi:hypothetical protein